MATLRTAAMNLLRLAGFGSIREGLQAVMHDITALLAMARRPGLIQSLNMGWAEASAWPSPAVS
jgi:hypothetical protein